MITGAFHEDGLADIADGFGAGGSPEKINKIIHDSRLGTYGTIALTLGLLIRLGLAINLVELGYSLILILSSSFASGKLSIIFTRNFFTVSTFSKTGSIIEAVSNKILLIGGSGNLGSTIIKSGLFKNLYYPKKKDLNIFNTFCI